MNVIQTQSLGLTDLVPAIAWLTYGLLTVANARAIQLLRDLLAFCTFVVFLHMLNLCYGNVRWYFKSFISSMLVDKHFVELPIIQLLALAATALFFRARSVPLPQNEHCLVIMHMYVMFLCVFIDL